MQDKRKAHAHCAVNNWQKATPTHPQTHQPVNNNNIIAIIP